MIKNKVIKELQVVEWQENGVQHRQEIKFDPDSSPEAWEHYKKFYAHIFKDYDFENLAYYNIAENGYFFRDKKVWLNFNISKPLLDKDAVNRLYALKKDTIIYGDYCEAANRLGGETDFNFNEEKIELFKEIIKKASNQVKEEISNKLEECAKKHHTLINFSLMQSMGNLQQLKGQQKYDRLDTFIWKLENEFFSKLQEIEPNGKALDIEKLYQEEELQTFIEQLGDIAQGNIKELISFLAGFKNIKNYVKKSYLIENEELIEKIIEQGKSEINTCKDVARYIELAEEFWAEKKKTFDEMENEQKYE